MIDWREKHLEMAIGNRYKSPVEVIQDQIEMQMEKDVMKVVQNYGINVDKEELLKALKYDREQYEKGYQDGINADKWIPCSERLPEEDGWYLETVICGIVKRTGFGLFKNGIWKHFDDEIKTIAWQPLPEPYKGE